MEVYSVLMTNKPILWYVRPLDVGEIRQKVDRSGRSALISPGKPASPRAQDRACTHGQVRLWHRERRRVRVVRRP